MAHSATPPPANPSYEDIVWLAGPRLLGLIFNWGLLGVLTAQVYIYFLHFPQDRRVLKGLVYSVYILDIAQTGAATYDAFQWFVLGWGNITSLYNLYTGFLNVPIISSIVGGAVQIFFGWRIWALSGSYSIFGLIVLLAVVQLGGGIGVAYFIYNDPSEVTRSPGLVYAVGIRLGGSALVDVVIAIVMTYYLIQSKERAQGRMNNILTRLVRLTIETGTVTAIAAIVDLVFFLKAHNAMHQVTGVTLAKLYSNTLLVIFNNRLIMIADPSFEQPPSVIRPSVVSSNARGESPVPLSEFRITRHTKSDSGFLKSATPSLWDQESGTREVKEYHLPVAGPLEPRRYLGA